MMHQKTWATLERAIESAEFDSEYCDPECRATYNSIVSFLRELKILRHRIDDVLHKLVKDDYVAYYSKKVDPAREIVGNYPMKFDIVEQTLRDRIIVATRVENRCTEQQLAITEHALLSLCESSDVCPYGDCGIPESECDCSKCRYEYFMTMAKVHIADDVADKGE